MAVFMPETSRETGVIDFSHLPPLERARRYRDLAEDARCEAENAKGAARESYRLIATQWEQLAEDIEKRARGDASGE